MARGGRKRRWLTALAVTVVLVGTAAFAPLASAAKSAPKETACQAQTGLGGFYRLAGGSDVKVKRVGCGVARAVVRNFPEYCGRAFAAQGRCTIRARGRWRCRSRIVGPAVKGAPSRQRCRRGRARVSFVVAYFPPVEPTDFPLATASAGPYNEARFCVDTSTTGTILPPAIGASYEIRMLGGVATTVGASLQQALVNHSADSAIGIALGSTPRNAPDPIPLYLTRGGFSAEGLLGVAAPTCSNPAIDALVARTNVPAGVLHSTAAHELFHAYSFWGRAGGSVPVPWFEEAAATWSEGKVGFPEVTMFDYLLQYPLPPDLPQAKRYSYAMSRFVQYLDDKGLVSAGVSWPLVLEVVDGYESPGATLALSGALVARNTTLGEQLAAFWGDRIRNKPAHGPQLQPSRRNARLIEVEPGRRVIEARAGRLDTDFINFTLGDNVRRVEFEFDAPNLGYFWGAPTERTSKRYFDDESVSFCVGGSDGDDLAWPVRFPVTFTNGSLGQGTRTGKITVRAQSDPEQCRIPSLNRACRVLRLGGVRQVLGPGRFPFASSSNAGGFRFWLCFYRGSSKEVSLNLARFDNRTPQQVRRAVTRQIDQLGLREVRAGDLAGAGVVPGDPNPAAGLVMAVGREIAFFIVGPGTDVSQAIRLARGVAGEI